MKRTNSHSRSTPSTVDAACDEESIAKLFASKYHSLYNQVSFDDEDMESVARELDQRIHDCVCECSICVTDVSVLQADVAAAAKRLNPGKRDGAGLFATDHIIHGGTALFQALAVLFTGMILP
jgi:hypothetical protein